MLKFPIPLLLQFSCRKQQPMGRALAADLCSNMDLPVEELEIRRITGLARPLHVHVSLHCQWQPDSEAGSLVNRAFNRPGSTRRAAITSLEYYHWPGQHCQW